ncbi:MAG: hypothetical protein ACRDOC_11805 [Streptosporangiaceae bacterium]
MAARQAGNGRRPDPPPQPADWDAAQYQPDTRTPLLTCRCGAKWTDDEPGRHAHRVVFSHQPRQREATPKEAP